MPRFSGTNNTNGYPYNKPAITQGHLTTTMQGVVTGVNTTGTGILSTYGEALYTTAGTYTWVCPPGVTSVCVLVVGSGGDGAGGYGGGGGGGGLAYANNITVTPGTSYTLRVAEYTGSTINGTTQKTSSYFLSPTYLFANSGGYGEYYGTSGTSQTHGGGGGAAGYTGRGGGGGTTPNTGLQPAFGGIGGSGGGTATGVLSYTGGSGGNALATQEITVAGEGGFGGGGGGGAATSSTSNAIGGGGVGLYGSGASGLGDPSFGKGVSPTTGLVNKGGSGGGSTTSAIGGSYGGGMGSGVNATSRLNGAVRIIWGGGRSFPSAYVNIISSDGIGTINTASVIPNVPFSNATSLTTTANNQGLAFQTNIGLSGNFTIEFWARVTQVTNGQLNAIIDIVGLSSERVAITCYDGVGSNWAFRAAGLLALTPSTFNTSSPTLDSTLAAAGTSQYRSNQWIHIAVTRDSNIYRMFVDGVMKAKLSGGASTLNLITANSVLSISKSFIGSISNLRIITGVGIYNSDSGFQPSLTNLTTTQTARSGVQASTVASDCKILLFTDTNSYTYETSSTTQLNEGSSRTFQVQTVGVPNTYPLAYRFMSTNTNFVNADFTDNITASSITLQQFDKEKTQLITCSDLTGAGPRDLAWLVPLTDYNRILNDSNNNTIYTASLPFSGAISYSKVGSDNTPYLDLTIPASNVGRYSGNFTIECWYFLRSVQSITSVNTKYLVARGDGNATQYWELVARVVGQNMDVFQFRSSVLAPSVTNNVVLTASGVAYTLNDTWNHIAVSRSGTTLIMHINGKFAGSAIVNTGTLFESTATRSLLWLGANTSCVISNLRVVDGHCVYPTQGALGDQIFTPQTTPLIPIQPAVSGQPNIIPYSDRNLTTFLLATDNSSAVAYFGTGITPKDTSTYNHTLTFDDFQFPVRQVGYTSTTFSQIRSVDSLLNGSVNGYVFNDRTGHITLSSNTNWIDISGTNFTIECWINLASWGINTVRPIVSFGSRADATQYLCSFQINANNNLEFITYYNGTAQSTNTLTSSVTHSVWNHIAVVVTGSSLSFYINGTRYSGYSVGTFSFFGSRDAMQIRIGSDPTGRSRTRGAISNLRIVREALYTDASITVPTPPLSIAGTINNINNPLRLLTTITKTATADETTEGNEIFTFNVSPTNTNTLPVKRSSNITKIDTSLTPITATKNASLPATIIEVIGRASQGWQLFSSVTGGLGSNYSYSAPILPAGLTVNSTTGNLSGTPSGSATNSTYTVNVDQIPAITGQTAKTGSAIFAIQVVNVLSLSFDTAVIANSTTPIYWINGISKTVTGIIISGGTTSYTISNINPALPSGLTATIVSVSTGGVTTTRIRIEGTATVNTNATSYTFTVTDTATPIQSQTISVTLRVVPVLTNTVASANWIALVSSTITDTTRYESWQMILGSGGLSPYTYSISSGTLPTGLSLGASTGILSGNTPATTSTTTIGFRVTDSIGQTATVSHPIIITTQIAGAGKTTVLYKGMASISLKDVGGAQRADYMPDNLLAGAPTGGYGDKAYSSASAMISGFSAYINSFNYNLQDGYIDSRYTTAGITGTPATTITNNTTFTRAVTITDIGGYRGPKAGIITATVNTSLIVVNQFVATENTNIAQGLTYIYWSGDTVSFYPFTSVTGGYGAYSYSMIGSWSTSIGLTINATTGLISGTLVGSYNGPVSVTVKDAAWASRTVSFQLVVDKPEVYIATAGTTTWTVPAGVSSISIVGAGGGGGGGGGFLQVTNSPSTTDWLAGGAAGGGGAVNYINNLAVTPGDVFTITVGSGGSGGRGERLERSSSLNSYVVTITAITPGAGGNTTVEYTTRQAGALGGNKLVINAGGGARGVSVTRSTSTFTGGAGGVVGVNYTGSVGLGGSGGKGGDGTSRWPTSSYPWVSGGGGGGAGGYTGSGGNGSAGKLGSTVTSVSGVGNTGAGGGGGGGGNGGNGGSGGGFRGYTTSNGAGGLASSSTPTMNGYQGSVSVSAQSFTSGGGGGATYFGGVTAGSGGSGMVRILYNTTITRNFPSTNVGSL